MLLVIQGYKLAVAPITELQQRVLINGFTGLLMIQCYLQALHSELMLMLCRPTQLQSNKYIEGVLQ